MSGWEMAKWEVYSRLEPFGWDAGNILAAGIRYSSQAPYFKKGHNPKLDDFMFDFCGERKKRMVGPKDFMAGLKGLARKKKGD